ncbi:PEGA domain-containing protein [Haliangium sp.]|uniref:PEGA domain-containing protein n=1 Tax=Haliangium sp. TaxID=2663208 RepID=UPI003D0C0B48
MGSRLYIALVIVAAALAGPAEVVAQDDGMSAAEKHFYEAQSAYEKGHYADAAAAFTAAYDAKALPELLFNIGACYEKLAKAEPATIVHWQRAIEYYQRYLEANPQASDRDAIEARIKVLEDEHARIAAEAERTEAGEEPAAPVETSAEVEALAEIGIRGLVVIESDPPGAVIYLDDKRQASIGITPWSGTIEGEHTVYIEREGYEPVERRIAPSSDKLLVLAFSLAEEDHLGWLKVTSNVPGADVYIDDKSVGVYRKTPFNGNLPPGEHKIWVTADGYDEFYSEFEIEAGKTHEIEATLEGSPVGYLDVGGRDIDRAAVYLDGQLLCERGPCRKPIPTGEHEVSVERDGYKPYRRDLEVEAHTELSLYVTLAEEPGRGDAIWAYVFTAAFAAGGVYLGLQAQGLEDDLRAEITAGTPPPDSNDPRLLRGKLFSIGADVGYGLAGISMAAALYYTFRDKGEPSKGTIEAEKLSLTPLLGPGHAGVGMEVRW